MITISLDEYGEFEKDDNKPLFIAGLIFDDQEMPGNVHNEERTERERIRAYYKAVISDAGEGFSYPQDLHSNGNKLRDRNVIAPVKDKVAETLPEFISKGTYSGKSLCDEKGRKIANRMGKYNLFVMLKSDDGKKSLLSANANMLANDDWAANRYFHMASSVVNRIIFHNPFYKQGQIPSINIDIATRSTGNVNAMDSKLLNEFKKQAYKVSEVEGNNYSYYSIMNSDIYRTIIAQEMVNSGHISIKLEKLFVRSIKYNPNAQMMEFLYLSDSLCSMLSYKLEGTSADAWLDQIIERAKRINPNSENLIFGYDEIDNLFSKAWLCYENKRIFDALDICYDAGTKEGRFAEHYREYWFPYLEQRVQEAVTPQLFTKSIDDLYSVITTSNLNQEKLLYIMKQFEQMIDQVADKYRSIDMKASTLYKLYDAGLTAFCHVGNATKALEYYEKCKQYAFYVGVDAFLRTNNRLIVCLEDSFEWDRAEEIAKENVNNQQLVSEIKREVLNVDESSNFLDEAKALSQLARIYAEKRDTQAEEYFRKSLSKLEKGSANYKITQSYLLHYYADMGMQTEFDKEMADYFDGKGTYNQALKYITSLDESTHSVFSTGFALYVLFRGLFYFHQSEIDEALWNRICRLDDTLSKKNGHHPVGHPWEIIFKYLEILALKRNDIPARENFSKLKKDRLSYRGEIITALEVFGDAEIAEYENDIPKRDLITNDLTEFLKDKFPSLKDVIFSSNGEERYLELQQYFTFMYR